MPTPSPRNRSKIFFVALGLALSCGTATLAHAQGDTGSTNHPWKVPTPRLKAEAYFTNLKDGDKIETPFVLKFGLSGGWGLAPISKTGSAKSGHHHLLVNRELPLNFKEALPFNDQYIHFGSGQMETVIDFKPGTYTLRMLLADQKHLPHFVYSRPATITVTKKNATDPKTLVQRGIGLMVDEKPAHLPFRVQFHASDLRVGQQTQGDEKTGHFALKVESTSGKGTANLSFPDGQTEVYLSPPSGAYRLTLQWVNNGAKGAGESVAPATGLVTVP